MRLSAHSSECVRDRRVFHTGQIHPTTRGTTCENQHAHDGLVAHGDTPFGEEVLDIRKLREKRWYSQTLWLIISGGNR